MLARSLACKLILFVSFPYCLLFRIESNHFLDSRCFSLVFYLRFTVRTTSTRSLTLTRLFVRLPAFLVLHAAHRYRGLGSSFVVISLKVCFLSFFFWFFPFKPHLPPFLSRHIFVEGDLFLGAHRCYDKCTYLV